MVNVISAIIIVEDDLEEAPYSNEYQETLPNTAAQWLRPLHVSARV